MYPTVSKLIGSLKKEISKVKDKPSRQIKRYNSGKITYTNTRCGIGIQSEAEQSYELIYLYYELYNS